MKHFGTSDGVAALSDGSIEWMHVEYGYHYDGRKEVSEWEGKQSWTGHSIHSGSFQRRVVPGDRLHWYRQPEICKKKHEKNTQNSAINLTLRWTNQPRSRKRSRKTHNT